MRPMRKLEALGGFLGRIQGRWEGWGQGQGYSCLSHVLIPQDPPRAEREAPPLSPAPRPPLPAPPSPDHMAQKGPRRAGCRRAGLWFTSAGSRQCGHVLTYVHRSLWPQEGEGESAEGQGAGLRETEATERGGLGFCCQRTPGFPSCPAIWFRLLK